MPQLAEECGEDTQSDNVVTIMHQLAFVILTISGVLHIQMCSQKMYMKYEK